MRHIVALLLVLLLPGLLSCSATALQTQETAARALAVSVNTVSAKLATTYETELTAAVEAPDRATSDAQVLAVVERWAPVWAALDAFAAAHDAWYDAIDRGGTPDPASVLTAYCALRVAVGGLASLPALSCDTLE